MKSNFAIDYQCCQATYQNADFEDKDARFNIRGTPFKVTKACFNCKTAKYRFIKALDVFANKN